MKSAFIKITLNHGSHRFLLHYSFPERLYFVYYHAVINLPHLIIGYNHQKLTWTQFVTQIVTRGPFFEPCEQSFFIFLEKSGLPAASIQGHFVMNMQMSLSVSHA